MSCVSKCEPEQPFLLGILDRCLVTAAGVNVCTTEALQAREILSSLSLPGFDFAHETWSEADIAEPFEEKSECFSKNIYRLHIAKRVHTKPSLTP